MESLGDTLKIIGPHLPPGFSASNGIKSLFPAGYAGSISALDNYVYIARGTDTIDQDDYGNYFVAADGMGRWVFSWIGYPYSLAGGPGVIPDLNIRLQAGFTFLYTNDGAGHGYVDSSRPVYYAQSCNAGTDPWISDNWPTLFASGVFFHYQQAAGLYSLPSASEIWTKAGFGQNNFVALNGNHMPCASNGTGSTIFQEVYVSMQVRDPSLLVAAQGMTTAQFADLWANSAASQATIDNLSRYWTVRYVSSDARTVVVSGSFGSFASAPAVTLEIADATSAQFVNYIKGAAEVFLGGALVGLGVYGIGAGAPMGNVFLIYGGAAAVDAGGQLYNQGVDLMQPFVQSVVDSLVGLVSSNSPSGANPASQLPDGSALVGQLPAGATPQGLVTPPATPVATPSTPTGGC